MVDLFGQRQHLLQHRLMWWDFPGFIPWGDFPYKCGPPRRGVSSQLATVFSDEDPRKNGGQASPGAPKCRVASLK